MSPFDPSSPPPTDPEGFAPPQHRRDDLLLDGPLERTSVDSATLSFVTGLLGLGAAFILFQFVVSPVVLLIQIGLSDGGMASLSALEEPGQLLSTYTRELMITNSIGQVLGLAVPALIFARLHSSRVMQYLRLRNVDGRILLLVVVGVIGLQPVAQWLAELNRQIPLPEGLRALDETQLEVIQAVLASDLGLTFNLIMMALVPAICEEVLFRGYAQRQFERATGPAMGVVLSGVLFGLYHLRPSQLIPLVVLGLFMAYLVWRTGSLLPAMLVHVVHNGLAVAAARYVETQPAYDLETLEHASMPWYAIFFGFVILGGVLYLVHAHSPRVRGR